MMEELSKGMGNQIFYECPYCRIVFLFSGEVLTQSWPKINQEGSKLNADRPLQRF
jgi:hypothetical protein